MRKMTGAISTIAFVALAFGVWSQTALVTKAAGLVAGLRMGEQTAAAKVAYRFPTGAEMFRAAAFVKDPHNAGTQPVAAPGKAEALQGEFADCARLDSPYSTTDCLVRARGKPVEPAVTPAQPAITPVEPTIMVERRVAANTTELVRPPVAAGSAPSSCKQNLPAATARMERALAHAKGIRPNAGPDLCAAYRRDFFDMVQARAVTALCKTGVERDQDLGRIDSAVESINGAIAQSCGI
jgi:hypothetical protein